MSGTDADFLSDRLDHRVVLGRLIDVSSDERRLVTPTELVADGSIQLGGRSYPPGVQPPDLLIVLDDLMGAQLVERIVPIAGESSYRATELGLQRMRGEDERH